MTCQIGHPHFFQSSIPHSIEYKSIFLSLYFYIPSGFRTSRGLIIVLVECGFQSSGVPERDLLKSVFRTAS